MPSFYNRQPNGFPLTPPDFASYNAFAQQSLGGSQGMNYGPNKGSHDMLPMMQPFTAWTGNQPHDHGYSQQMRYAPQQYMQQQTYNSRPNTFKMPPGLGYPNHTRYQSMDASNNTQHTLLRHASSDHIYDTASQPSKVPFQVPEHKSVQPQPEEKPVGGVSAVLDYEMDDMADFVASVASEIVVGLPQTPAPAFRKFVFQVLTSTRLPSSTIILGLEYMSIRMKLGSINMDKSNQLYKILTIGFLLSSKFLDDNTFQNRSWAEVTGIPVTELNVLEKEWLSAIGWTLHVSNDGFNKWQERWSKWLAKKKSATLATLTSTISANRRHTMSFTPAQQNLIAQHVQANGNNAGLDRSRQQTVQTLAQSQTSFNDSWWMSNGQSAEYSPPSAPDSGPATPEWNLGLNWASHFAPTNHISQVYQQHGRPLSQQIPSQALHSWTCNCGKCCAQAYRPTHPSCGYGNLNNIFTSVTYGQTVV